MNCVHVYLLFILSLLFSTLEGEGVINYRRGLDSNGSKAVAWATYAPGGSSVLVSTCIGSVGNWHEPTTLSITEKAIDPLIAVIANNQDISVVVTWTEVNEGITSLYGAMRVNEKSGWSSPIRISLESEDVQKQIYLKISSSGRMMAIWSSLNAQNIKTERQATAQMGLSNTWNVPVSVPGS